MKFTKSERTLHEVNFNPPCNHYAVEKTYNNKKQIVSGSLAGPTLLNQKNTFGNTQRFQDKIKADINVGPHSYFQNKKQIMYDFNKDLSKPHEFLRKTYRDSESKPSIPFKKLDQKQLEQEDLEFLKQIQLMKDPLKAEEKLRKKEASYSFSKSPRKILSKDTPEKTARKAKHLLEPLSESIPQENVCSKTKSNSHQKSLVENKKIIRKAAEKRNEIINAIHPQFVPSLQLIELISKRRTKYVPGPGAYKLQKNHLEENACDLDLALTTNKKGISFTTVKRFIPTKNNVLGPGSYEVNQGSLSQKGTKINKQKRFSINIKSDESTSYRFYLDPYKSDVMQKDQPFRSVSCSGFRKLSFKDEMESKNAFGSGSRRFSVSSQSSLNKNQKPCQSRVSDYQLQKKKAFQKQLKIKQKQLKYSDRLSTKADDSGLLSLQTMAAGFQ